MFGEKGRSKVIEESRDITHKLAYVLKNAEATENLRVTRDLDESYELTDGEELRLLKNLRSASKSLNTALTLVPRVNNSEVINIVDKCKYTLDSIMVLLNANNKS